MIAEVIKSFLVGLGFEVDESTLTKFNKSLAMATVRVTALYASIKLASAGIFKAISGISANFEELGYSLRLVSPSLNKMLLLREAMLKAYRVAGVDLVKAVQQSIKFNYSLARTKYALEAVYKSVGLKFLPMLTKQMDIFRQKIFANMPKIQNALRKFVGFIFQAFQGTVHLGATVWSILGRVYDFFVKLDEATGGWSTRILGFIAIWKLLNLSFLATPLGALLAGLTSILVLYDDFKTFQEGGTSFFNWSSAIPVINAVYEALSDVFGIVSSVWGIFKNLGNWNLDGVIANVNRLADILGDLAHVIDHIADALDVWIGKAFPSVAKFFNGPNFNTTGQQPGQGGFTGPLQPALNGATNLLGNPGAGASTLPGAFPAKPLLPQGATDNSRTNKVSLETNVNVQASGDASAIGDQVASRQGSINRDNFNLINNILGNTQ